MRENMETITPAQFRTALRTTKLPKNLSEFNNLLYQLDLYIGKNAKYLPVIGPDYCYLALLQIYVQIMCPHPDGGRHLIARFGALIETVFGEGYPEYAAAIEALWSESHLIAGVLNQPTLESIH